MKKNIGFWGILLNLFGSIILASSIVSIGGGTFTPKGFFSFLEFEYALFVPWARIAMPIGFFLLVIGNILLLIREKQR